MTEVEPASSTYAVGLLSACIESGVTDVIVCPGSRSQSLALAAAEAERSGALRLHVRTDERSAGFFALGIARETGVPAPVIVTSGSAVANLMPAVLEAHEGRVPLLLLTADRPAELRATRSNQTTRQAHLFESVARLSLDIDTDEAVTQMRHQGEEAPLAAWAVAARAMLAAIGEFGALPAGPVQVNLQFREPLSGPMVAAQSDFERAADARSLLAQQPTDRGAYPQVPDSTYVHEGDALTVVVAGQDAGDEAELFAREAGLPLLAEVVSGARFGREAIVAYATLIEDPAVGQLTERAVVFGHPTLTRQLPALLRRADVEVIVVDPHVGPDVDHYAPTDRVRVVREAQVSASYNAQSMRRWLGAWVVADRQLREKRSTLHEPNLEAARATGYKERSEYAKAELAAMREPLGRELLTDTVWRASWPHDRLVFGASRLVRVLDSLAHPRRVTVHANRGLAGIDGTLATALGVAVASQHHADPVQAAGVTRVLLGDLALLHDAGSMQIPAVETSPRIQVFVGNDGGGTIFDTLEAAGTAPADAFDRVMFTEQHVDLSSLAAAYGWEHRLVRTRGELEQLLTEQVTGPQLIEVPLTR